MTSLLTLLPDWPAFSIFLAACFAVGASPGPGMMFAVARAVEQGRKAGVVSVLGLSTASLIWCLAAAFGVAAIIATSPLAYDVLRYMGAGYLVYLAIRTIVLRAGPPRNDGNKTKLDSYTRLYFQAVATNLMNPKSFLFYLSFVPQFIDAERGNVIAQFILLGVIFNIMGNTMNLSAALFFGRIGEWLAQNPKIWRMQQWFTATVFCSIAAHLLFAARR